MSASEPDVAWMRQAHRDRCFPRLLRGAELGDIDVVLLDAYTSGCVSTWLGNGGRLHPDRSRILATCVEDLDTVIAVFINADESYYLQQLRIMAAAVLAETQR